jgi:hypothetical protein
MVLSSSMQCALWQSYLTQFIRNLSAAQILVVIAIAGVPLQHLRLCYQSAVLSDEATFISASIPPNATLEVTCAVRGGMRRPWQQGGGLARAMSGRDPGGSFAPGGAAPHDVGAVAPAPAPIEPVLAALQVRHGCGKTF